MTISLKSLAFVLAGSALAVSANASTVSYSFSNPLQTTEIDQIGSLSLFDSALGTLTGISLTFSGANQTNISLTNNAAQTQTTRATSSTELYFNSTLGGLNTLIAAANPVITLSATTGLQTLAAGATVNFGPLFDADSITWNSELSTILGSFSQAGGGIFSLGCSSLSGIAISGGGGNIGSVQTTQANCGGEIVYTYADAPPTSNVPEPTSLALMGLALGGLAFVSRKKNQS